MVNARKQRDIKLVTTKKGRKYLVAEPNYYTTKFFTEGFLATEMRKCQILVNKPVYLGLSILDLRKTVTYDFLYDYVNAKYGENVKICYMDTDGFILHEKTNDIYKYITEDVEARFDTSSYELDRPILKLKMKKVIGLMN